MQSHRLHFRGRRKRWRSWACSRSKSEWHAVIGGAILRKKHTSDTPRRRSSRLKVHLRVGTEIRGGVTRRARYPVACTRKVRYYTSAKRRSAYTRRRRQLVDAPPSLRAPRDPRRGARAFPAGGGAVPAGRPGPRPRRVSGLAQRPAWERVRAKKLPFRLSHARSREEPGLYPPVPLQTGCRGFVPRRGRGPLARLCSRGGGATRLIAPKGSLHSPVAVCW